MTDSSVQQSTLDRTKLNFYEIMVFVGPATSGSTALRQAQATEPVEVHAEDRTTWDSGDFTLIA